MFKNKLSVYTDKDLYRIQLVFEKTLENESLFCSGLCFWFSEVRYKLYGEIYIPDIDLATEYMNMNRPLFSKFRIWSDYYWPYGKITPRIRFLKKHIALIQKERTRRILKYMVSDETEIINND